jgi:ribose transport system substrate-binding protein
MRIFGKRALMLNLGLSALLGSVAGNAFAQDKGSLAIIVTNFQNVAEVSMAEGFTQRAEAMGYTVVQMDPKGSVEKQANAIDDAIAQGVKGIGSIVLDSAVAKTWVDKANENNVRFSAVAVQVGDPSAAWSDVYPGLTSLTGRDDFGTGVTLAGFAATMAAADKPLKVGLVEGMPGYSTVVNLTNGFKAGLDKAGVTYEVSVQQPTDWTQAKGQEVCQNALVSNPDIDVFFAHAMSMAIGCADAIADVGSTAKVISAAGGMKSGEDYVRDGRITAAACEPWHAIGALSAASLIQAIEDPRTPMAVLTTINLPIYTKDNVEICSPEW